MGAVASLNKNMDFTQFKVRRRELYILKTHALARTFRLSSVQAALLVH
jgi:hypothetical protein